MKKLILLLLISIILCSCQKVDIQGLAVFVRDETDSAILLTLDENDNVIKEYDIEYPARLFYQDNYCYYSYDGENYKKINYQNGKIIDSLQKVCGDLLHVFDDNKYISVDDNCVYFASGIDEFDYKLMYLYGYFFYDGYSYLIDSSNNLYIYKDLEFVNSYVLPSSDVMYLTNVDNKVYLISEKGVSEINQDDLGTTYTYRLTNYEITDVSKGLIYMLVEDETVIYHMSFNELSMDLVQELDDKYYRSHYLYDIFRNYYDNGYYVYNYQLLY